MTTSTTTHASRTVVLDLPFEEALEACRATASALPSEIRTVDPLHGALRAKVPACWQSRGDLLSFQLARTASPAQTKVIVSSRPAHRLTLVDYGKNDENVVRAVSLLGV